MAASGPADDEGPDSPAASTSDADASADRRGWIRQLSAFGSVGMVFPVAIGLGFLGGWWLDGKLGTTPWLSLTGFALGVAAALRNLIQSVRDLDEAEREDRRSQIERRRRRGGPRS